MGADRSSSCADTVMHNIRWASCSYLSPGLCSAAHNTLSDLVHAQGLDRR